MKLLIKELNDGTKLCLKFIPGCDYRPTKYLYLGVKLPNGTVIISHHITNKDLEFFYQGAQCFDIE